MRSLRPLAAFAVACPGAALAEIDFNRDIRPLLSANCFACHGPDAHDAKGDLQLHSPETAREVIASGEFLARIHADDADEVMPPPDSGKALDAEQRALLKRWIEAGANYDTPWAYVPPVKRVPPPVDGGGWSPHWVDRFLSARWAEEGVEPAPDADPVTLARRLHFDLTGLPPEPGAVRDFVAADDREAAYLAMVETLLASEHFGERMATYWLDVVRYADTVGYHGDQDHNISPYRDYVIGAFNRNLPFDQFTREQLAGDLLPEPTLEQRVATGYNRLLQTSHEGGVQPKEYLAIYGADRVRNVSAAWMGGTLGCAQCHDHKYDPYTMRDFYAMEAFFADVDEARHFKEGTNALPTKRPPEIEVADGRLTMVTQAVAPRVTRILPRGNWLDDSGEVVAPAVPEFLGKLETGGRPTRLDLAEWLVDAEGGAGGLTARVWANRLWYLFFGEGLSPSLDDFGGQGVPPSHPELLDGLAIAFYEGGWDVKALVKHIVTSRAYRLSSVPPEGMAERDPENRLFARQGRHRLPAESVRDAALAVGGLLNRAVGGASAKPYQPEGYYRHLNFPPREYRADTGDARYRRSVYVHWQRQFLHPVLKALDAPTREECTAKRPRSNTPLAALVQLNDPGFVAAARGLAGVIEAEGLAAAFERALSRELDATERAILERAAEEGALTAARAILNCSEFNTRN